MQMFILKRFVVTLLRATLATKFGKIQPQIYKKFSTKLSLIQKDLEMTRIIWMDMEMTGLDIEKDKIMEIACIVSDAELNIIAEGPHLIIKQPEELLSGMDKWCRKHHKKSGLTEACLRSTMSVEQAENEVLTFLKLHVNERSSPLAGNSVYMDRLFLIKYMPTLNNFLHYRIIDVSTIKELCLRWNKSVYDNVYAKEYKHRALDDVRESIKELKYYKNNFCKLVESENHVNP